MLTDTALAARERVSAALVEVGPELSGVLVDVCCHLTGLAETEKSNGWPQRSGKIILQIALTRLARHYEPERDGSEPNESRKSRIAHWGADGFRPTLENWS